MRVVLQRVTSATVRVAGETVGQIGRGLVALVGVEAGDGATQVSKVADKVVHLRVFEDDDGKMNRSALEIGAAVLVVSNFTVAGSLRKGRRPSFDRAAAPRVAEPLVDDLIERLGALGVETASGCFGALMALELVNDGPVTLVMEVSERPS